MIKTQQVSLLLILVSAMAMAQSNPVPLINNPLVPDAVVPGGPTFTLTVNGTGFVSGSVVNWNGVPLATTFVSGSQLTATVPASNISKAMTATVAVTTPAPGGSSSNAAFFEVRTPFSAASFGLTTLSPGTQPVWITPADLNGDGKLDLITTVLADSAVSISIGNGDGTFQPVKEYATAPEPDVVVTGDFNNDGNLDLAVSDSVGVSVLLGNGDGTFQTHRDISFAAGLQLVSGDFNNDGKLDLAVALGFDGKMAILLGNGDGTFQPAVNYTAGTLNVYAIAIGDFNQDGNLDLAATVKEQEAVAILLGNGDGTFGDPTDYATSDFPASIVTADFNGDSNLDLAVGGTFFGQVSVLLGNGNGTFQSPVDYTSPLGITGGITTCDLNGDGILDLVTATNGTMIATFLGIGDGAFQLIPGLFSSGSGTDGLAAGDFNNDGLIDIATANLNDNTLSLLPQVTSVLSRTNVSFNKVSVGSKATMQVAISNIGATSFTINKIGLAGKGVAQFSEGSNCKSSLAVGASCTIRVVFQPLAQSKFTAFLKISDSAAASPQTVLLRGTGVN